jgi:glycerol-3-phosphate acyltransferase PlsY
MIDMLIGLFIVAYLIGSIPSGFLIARLQGIADIRDHGSGNIGATNVARVLGIKYFFIVFFLDFFKAYALLLALSWYGFGPSFLVVASLGLLLGNAFPLFLQFRGGKGVATMFGVFMGLQPLLVVYAFICWLLVFILTSTVGLASIVTLLFVPFCSFFITPHSWWMGCFSAFVAVLGLFLHRNNIKAFLNNPAP